MAYIYRLAYCTVGMDIYNCTFTYYLSFSWTCAVPGIALNDLSDVCSASVSFMDSTDNLTRWKGQQCKLKYI